MDAHSVKREQEPNLFSSMTIFDDNLTTNFDEFRIGVELS